MSSQGRLAGVCPQMCRHRLSGTLQSGSPTSPRGGHSYRPSPEASWVDKAILLLEIPAPSRPGGLTVAKPS